MNAHAHVQEAEAGHVTPSMAQFFAVKAENPDYLLFFRMGDFFELFFEDAQAAAPALGIVLSKRGKHKGVDIPICGVPVSRHEEYLNRLIALGHRVAVCDQVEDAAEARKRGHKAVVRREVVRLVTPGTVTEDGLLEPGRANVLLAVARAGSGAGCAYGLAAVDISTGSFEIHASSAVELASDVARIDPREVLVSDEILSDEGLRPFWKQARFAITPVARDGMGKAQAERRVTEHFGVASLDAYGDFAEAGVAAAGMALSYVERTQVAARPRLCAPRDASSSPTLRLDPATRASLEICRSSSGERRGSLLHCVDRTVTPAGGRLLAERLAGPSTDIAVIEERLESVDWLLSETGVREGMRSAFRGTPDVMRAVSRLALGRGGPRDLAAVRDFASVARTVGGATAPARPKGEAARHLRSLGGVPEGLERALAETLSDELPLRRSDGGYVREGRDPALDELRRLASDSRQVIAGLQARYAEETGCRTLRIKHTGQLGYFVEVPAAAGEALLRGEARERFVHRQTMTGAMRFSTAELSELESRIATAGERSAALEEARFEELRAAVMDAHAALAVAAAAVAALDVSAGVADLAASGGWVRPVVEDGGAFDVVGGRHPVVDAALREDGEAFVPNACDLSGGRLLLVTGPNMGGKSTFLRQNALVAVLAQAGAFVPAGKARIGIVDRLFSRVGASDDLSRGRSTFMVEMVETAAILNQATERSLVVLDEIGRGTSTHDGLSIAWAAVEHLHGRNRCRAIFATHYHELTALERKLPRLANATLKVADWEGDVVFLHEVVPGAADRSYGLHVAKLAGLPPEVVARAGEVLADLQKDGGKRKLRAVEDLPLFAAAPPPPPPAKDAVRAMVEGIDPDGLSPREALEALYRLAEAART